MARAMVQATLPHKRIAGTYFERKNDPYTLTLLAPPSKGLTYGSIPCLLLALVTTEAVETKSLEFELGASITAFMTKLGMPKTDIANGNITSPKNKTR
ncbi:MAG: hypothetical protein IPH54_13080 [Rhodoferax sp.]|nr:hypothetical protein [Rhodoferax sp.]